MNLSSFEIKVIIGALSVTWGVIVPTIIGLLWWFVRKDRAGVFSRIAANESDISAIKTSIGDLDSAVFGIDGDGGVSKWEHRARNLIQPIATEVATLTSQVNKLRLAIARALPSVNLSDLGE